MGICEGTGNLLGKRESLRDMEIYEGHIPLREIKTRRIESFKKRKPETTMGPLRDTFEAMKEKGD
ncbi:hypothetical protein DPMN_073745 [Dreissena polymorpha]|uniref:Uncharacterized protein n=1 Tax=Dreissena polymorpha TaxID=45954 RepID=A0A9D4BZK5_DREPO|nr:hypothetical protein DPMN_073745 [Dreissena polymorpha]